MYLLGAPEIDMVAGLREELQEHVALVQQQAEEIDRLQKQTEHDAYLSEACRSMERSYNVVKAQAMELEEERPGWQAEVERLTAELQYSGGAAAAAGADVDKLTAQLNVTNAAHLATNTSFEARLQASEAALAKATAQSTDANVAHHAAIKGRDALNLELEDRLVELERAKSEKSSLTVAVEQAANMAAQANVTIFALETKVKELEAAEVKNLTRAATAEATAETVTHAGLAKDAAQAVAMQDAANQAAELRALVETRVERQAQDLDTITVRATAAESQLVTVRAELAAVQEANRAAIADGAAAFRAAVQQVASAIKTAASSAAEQEVGEGGCDSPLPCNVRTAVLAGLSSSTVSETSTEPVAWIHTTLAGLAAAVARLPFGTPDPTLQLQADERQAAIVGLEQALAEINSGLKSIDPSAAASSNETQPTGTLVTKLLAQIKVMREKALEAHGNAKSLETMVSVTNRELDKRIEEITELKMTAEVGATASTTTTAEVAAAQLALEEEKLAAMGRANQLEVEINAAKNKQTDADARLLTAEAAIAATVAEVALKSGQIIGLEDDLWTRSAEVEDLQGQLRMFRAKLETHGQKSTATGNALNDVLEAQIQDLQTESLAAATLLASKESEIERLHIASKESALAAHHEESTAAMVSASAGAAVELEAAQASAAALEARVAELTELANAPSQTELKEVKEVLAIRERELMRLKAVLTDAKSQADNSLKERIHTLQTALTTSEDMAAAAVAAQQKNKLDTATELAVLRSTLKSNDAMLKELTEGQDLAATAVAQQTRLKGELGELEKKVDGLESLLATEKTKVAALEGAANAEAERIAAEAAAAEDAQKAGVGKAKSELSRLSGQLAKATAERDALQKALKTATAELKTTNANLAQAMGAMEGQGKHHVTLRQLVMSRYERTFNAVWAKVADGKELEFERSIIDNPIDLKADPTREWNSHCSELDAALIAGVDGFLAQIAAFPEEIERVKEIEREELNRVKRLHSDQADRLKTKIERSQKTLQNFDGSLQEMEEVKAKAEADAAKLSRAQSDLARVTKKLEEQRAQVVTMRDRLDDEKQLVQQLTRQVSAPRAPVTRAVPSQAAEAMVSQAANMFARGGSPSPTREGATSPSRAGDRMKSEKIKERLSIVNADSRDFRNKNAKLITTLRKENSTSQLEATKAAARVEVMQHRLAQAEEKANVLHRKISHAEIPHPSTNP
jgi:chromosome segregation ATPase